MSTGLHYELLTLYPAPGWRVVYLDHNCDLDADYWITEPLLHWGVCWVTGPGVAGHHEVHGVVDGDESLVAVVEERLFWCLLSPGAPDPHPDQLVAEWRRRNEIEDAMSRASGNADCWGDLFPVTVEHAAFARDGADGWHLAVRSDDGRPGEIAIMIETHTPDGHRNAAGLGLMFRRLAALGIPTGPPTGPVGEQPWWDLGWDEIQIAAAMVGRRVMARTNHDDGWEIEPRVTAPQ
jgi:hypothetical protein